MSNPKFRSLRYQERGRHLHEMGQRQFGTTDVSRVVAEARHRNHNAKVWELWFGDPSAYPNLDPFDRFHAHIKRWLNFHSAADYSRYMLNGYSPLVEQLRRGSVGLDYIDVPHDVDTRVTSGVAGALRMICPALLLPPDDDAVDNVIVPKWTYLSHTAEAALAMAHVKSCQLDNVGQPDLDHLATIIDDDTRMLILATVGNPLATAISPEHFDELLRVVHTKMLEFNHPIVVVADVIYEHFRRNGNRIDAIQRALHLARDDGLLVPVIETSSFSKLMAMAGQRIGFYRALLHGPDKFREELGDMRDSLAHIYGTSLCPVSSLLQMGLGSLYVSINTNAHIEEELAPLAAILTAVDNLTKLSGLGHTSTFLTPDTSEEFINVLGVVSECQLDPKTCFTKTKILKRAKKLAQDSFQKYGIDIDLVLPDILDRLQRADFLECIEVKLTQKQKEKILQIVALKSLAGSEHCSDLQSYLAMAGEIETSLKGEFSSGFVEHGSEIQILRFYKLKKSVPALERTADGRLVLYGISTKPEFDSKWLDIACLCDISSEDQLYVEHKEKMRARVFERVDYFLTQLDQMRKEGLGIYLHPAYYDEQGELDVTRVNAFYILWGFEALRKNKC